MSEPVTQPVTDPYTNPDELFDVYDGAGRPTGRTKRRADVHRDGDWHRSLHCWVTSEGGAKPALLLQRRGAHKDTWPSRLDVTVGGHFAAGETLADVVREVEEEIGRTVAVESLVRLGRRVCASEQERGVLDRELQEVYLWRSDAPLDAYRPQPGELTAIEEVAVEDLLQLLGGHTERIPARVLTPDMALSTGWVRREDFIPTLDSYFYRIATLADLALRGYPHLVV